MMTFSKRILTTTALAGVLTLGAVASAHAAGFFIQEQSTSGQGMSFAGSGVNHNDASIIFFNPSGMTHLDGAQANVNASFLYTHTQLNDRGSTFDSDGPSGGTPAVPTSTVGYGSDGGNPGGLNLIPSAYYAAPISDDNRWWAGFGISTPFGLGADYGAGFFGSFLVTEVDLRTIDFQPTVAYQVNDWISVGASAVVQYAEANFTQIVPSLQTFNLEGTDWALGYNIGVTLDPTEDLTIGLSYRSRTNLDLIGDQTATSITGPASDANAELNLPDIANLSASYDIDDQWKVLAGVTWFGWDNTDTLDVDPDSGSPGLSLVFAYENTINFNLGFEYEYDDEWTFRAGYQYDETPTQLLGRSALNPDGNRHWFSGGATYQYDDQWSIDGALTYIDINDANIDQTRGLDGVTPVIDINADATDSYAVVLALGVNYKF